MQQPHNIMIYEFLPEGIPHHDDEGDQMLGFYYQFTDHEDQPVSDLIGPYSQGCDVERAAVRALRSKDF